MLYGDMGSTLPLLVTEETMFCLPGIIAEILATGCRPLSRTNTKASTTAPMSSTIVRFLNRLSITHAYSFAPRHKHSSTSFFCKKPGLVCDCPLLTGDGLWRSKANIKLSRRRCHFSTMLSGDAHEYWMRASAFFVTRLCHKAQAIFSVERS